VKDCLAYLFIQLHDLIVGLCGTYKPKELWKEEAKSISLSPHGVF